MKLNKHALVMWLLMPIAGCASFNDARYEHTQKARARAAWRCVPDRVKQHCYPKDYEKGWKDGFYDVATGGKGCPPVVAPHEYWRPEQILEDCDNRRHAYYDGFQDGAASASRYPDTHHLKMWSSCECPLPVCENHCPATNTCPSGACGFSAFPETIVEGDHLPLEAWSAPAAQPNAVSSPVPGIEATELPAPEPEVVQSALKSKQPGNNNADSKTHSDAKETSEAEQSEQATVNEEDSVNIQRSPTAPIAANANSTEMLVDKSLLKEAMTQRSSVKPSQTVVSVVKPIVDARWLDFESEIANRDGRANRPAPLPLASPLTSTKATPSEKPLITRPASPITAPSIASTDSRSGIATIAKPFSVPAAHVPNSTGTMQAKVKSSTLHNEGMIEQAAVELAKPIVTPAWGLSVEPTVKMATGIELPSK
jgi:hypothetical protein